MTAKTSLLTALLRIKGTLIVHHLRGSLVIIIIVIITIIIRRRRIRIRIRNWVLLGFRILFFDLFVVFFNSKTECKC